MPSLDFALDHRVIGYVLRFSPIEPIGCASGNAQNVGYTSGREQERFWSYAKCSMSVLGTKWIYTRALRGRPGYRPRARAAAKPALVLSLIRERSNSASAPIT